MHEGHRERMRKKMTEHPDGLEPHEVLETLLFYSIPRVNVNEVAHRLLNEFGTVKGVLEANVRELTNVKGVGENTACLIKTVNKLLGFIAVEQPETIKIRNFFEANEKVGVYLKGLKREKAILLYLDRTGEVIGKTEFEGTEEEVVLNLQRINENLLLYKPHSVVFAHNHPNGTIKPSVADYETTKKLLALFKLNQVNFLDHIIVGEEEQYSFFGSGELQKIKDNLKYIL